MDDEPPDGESEASETMDVGVVWGAGAAGRWADAPAPRAWIVLGVLIGVPVLLFLLLIAAAHLL